MDHATRLCFAIYLYGPDAGPLPSRFEDVAQRLEEIERLHFEWDGSFVWRGSTGAGPWQLDGMIYDLGERIQYVDLKGSCPREEWRRLLEVFTEGRSEEASILRLPGREALNRDSFEAEIWGKSLPPTQLA